MSLEDLFKEQGEAKNILGDYFKKQREKEEKEKFIELLAYAIVFFVSPLIFMWIWNYIMPDLFSIKTISYWQAILIYHVVKNLTYHPHDKK